jgi:DNA-binding MarR family transcriptional regulator/predicted N-acetyltransferase YhbS
VTQLPLDQKIQALRRFGRFFAQRLGPLEAGPAGSSYSATEVRVLTELAQAERRTVSALSRSLGLDAGYLSRVIRRLETTGVVTKAADSADSRQQALSLTEAGQAEVRTLEAITTARYASLVRTLPAHIHQPLLDAMERIEGAFSSEVPSRNAAPWLLRPHRAGDISSAAQQAIASAREEFDLGAAHELAVMQTATEFLTTFDPALDCSWIAEREEMIVGSVLIRRAGEGVAALALLHVVSDARGIGIGRRLIAEAVAFAKRAGYDIVELELHDAMKSARFLVHAAGFRHAPAVPGRTAARGPAHSQRWSLDLRQSSAIVGSQAAAES